LVLSVLQFRGLTWIQGSGVELWWSASSGSFQRARRYT
jgi:hypothetical protein